MNSNNISGKLSNSNNLNSKKEGKREQVLKYIEEIYKKEQRFVSKREIRRIFHLELYNYFENVFDMYQKIGIEVPLCFCPKEFAKKKIIEFVRERSEIGDYPLSRELEKELGISIRTYFKNIEEIYEKADIDFRLYKKRKYSLEHSIYSNKKIEYIKDKVYKYIVKNVKAGIYPSVKDIQRDLNIAFYKYFRNTKEPYLTAGLNYYRPCPILLGKEKEIVFTEIIVELFKKMGFKIERISIFDEELYNKKEYLKIRDKEGNSILVELKAFKKYYDISKREVSQLKRYMDSQGIKKGIFITTSTKVNCNIKGIKVINGNKLCNLLGSYGLIGYLDVIEWIQKAKVNSKSSLIKKEQKRQKIIRFIKNYKGDFNKKIIENNLHISLKTYFPDKTFVEIIKEIKEPNNDSVQAYKVRQ